MGCSSSAQTKVKEFDRQTPKSPEANGLPQCGEFSAVFNVRQSGGLALARDDSLPITDKNDTGSDQTKLESLEEVKLGSWKKTDEDLHKEEPDALIQEITKCDLSTCHRVDPEGTEPQLMAPEETFDRSQCLSLDFLEAGGPQAVESTELASNPQVATEAAGSSPSEPLQDKKPEPTETSESGTPEPSKEEIQCFVTEIVTELLMDEEEHLTEVTVPGETGEKMETEMHHVIIPGALETKEETGEATLVTEIEQANEEE
ncbi:uncharacterized protein LOC120301472 isoform X1 [Crotalus tigris]|uniref:uncharacterized protein LOC120301472 isoform X1 n=1 Tax=Crotalus tigris TaxID=88082 RepID=UPI00192FB2F1|nr:uncharacterized protein LOC120301472 isoform X1 [Crotalus tigris]XP_039184729.1 uncharacterized protein LOC120301472 isoform X1 [Crotalus tigris]XP_039184730.1 uncharacterized protein LOC120301472 isoform X1 [Crotalus tigris]XP_039184731.1 uncharacterized protein LOC120301472 isoform X1 [Crotalus tigris]